MIYNQKLLIQKYLKLINLCELKVNVLRLNENRDLMVQYHTISHSMYDH